MGIFGTMGRAFGGAFGMGRPKPPMQGTAQYQQAPTVGPEQQGTMGAQEIQPIGADDIGMQQQGALGQIGGQIQPGGIGPSMGLGGLLRKKKPPMGMHGGGWNKPGMPVGDMGMPGRDAGGIGPSGNVQQKMFGKQPFAKQAM